MARNPPQTKASIPTIDLKAENAAADLLNAAITWGFVFLKHNDVSMSPNDVAEMFNLAKEFFASPTEMKAECIINAAASGQNRGWLPMQGETLDPATQKTGDFKEAFNLGEVKGGKAQQPLPKPMQPHEDRLVKFFEGCHELCNKILRLFADALEIQPEDGGVEWFSSRHDRDEGDSGSVLRLLHYPALPSSMLVNPEEDIRAGAHSDYGSVTLLFRLPDQPGLEILTPEGQWATVPVKPASDDHSEHLPILVNIGDLLSYWTNGLLKSTIHRVMFPKAEDGPAGGADRYSLVYFCHPLDDSELSEVPSRVVAAHRKSGNGGILVRKAMTAREHLNNRLAATYGVEHW